VKKAEAFAEKSEKKYQNAQNTNT